MVVIEDKLCERCQRHPSASVAFRHWTIVASASDGRSQVLPPTPGINRDGEDAMAHAIAAGGGAVRYQCPDFPNCEEGIGGVRGLDPAE